VADDNYMHGCINFLHCHYHLMPVRFDVTEPSRLKKLESAALPDVAHNVAGHLTTPTVAGVPGLCENFCQTAS